MEGMAVQMPDKPVLEGLEDKWRARWDKQGTYRFDPRRTREEVFSIDTPPPTVSGRLHIGHVFSYTHTDLIARYQRMTGKEVFYPIGWDDNGLNVERRVQLMTGTMVDPTLPYDPDFRRPAEPPKRPIPVSRPNFIELCEQIVPELEAEYHELWARVGLSIDWSHTYTTIGSRATKVSQRAFLKLLSEGVAYRSESPTLWDVDLRTAVAQAELDDREVPGTYQRLIFRGPGGVDLLVDTTRPELLPACVALVAHPDDSRYQPLFGQTAITPLFGVSVPIVSHHLGDPEKGTGLSMICTFGDTTDVIWWRELGLETRALVERNGTLRPVEWGAEGFVSDDPSTAQKAYDQIAGRSTKQAKEIVTSLLAEADRLTAEPRPITHSVKFWVNGSRPLEIVTSVQWFIRYPERAVLIELGSQINWIPEFMRVRYENWVNGLAGDWNITRQRYFGVPFPIWYPIDELGDIDYLSPIAAREDQLPVDPSTETPPGFEPGQRNQPGGFAADADVMDTWATSSLSPQIITGYHDDPDLFARTYPMDLRPQAHEIIRTWLFSTVVRAHSSSGPSPGEMRPSPVLSSTPIARSSASRPATAPTTRSRCLIASVRMPSVIGRPRVDLGSTWPSTRGRSRSDAASPPRCSMPHGSCSDWRATHRVNRPHRSTSPFSPVWPIWPTRQLPPLIASTTPVPSNESKSFSGPFAMTIWNWSKDAPTPTTVSPVARPGRLWRSLSRPCSSSSRLSFPM